MLLSNHKKVLCFHGCNIPWASSLFSQNAASGGDFKEFQLRSILGYCYSSWYCSSSPIFKPATSTAPVTTSKSSPETTVVPSNWQRSIPKTCWEVDLFIQTRLDIAFLISVVSQFMQAPTEEHLSAVHKILQYLKMTLGKGLLFGKSTKWGIEIYSGADWAGSMKGRRSTLGYCTYVWGNLVTWRSKKQSVVARSSAEAEFQAIALGAWWRTMAKTCDGGVEISTKLPMKMFCDNQAAISISHNPIHHDRTKHVEIDRHFIKEKVENGEFLLQYTPTKLQTTDILTKALPRQHFDSLISKLGMVNIYSSVWGGLLKP